MMQRRSVYFLVVSVLGLVVLGLVVLQSTSAFAQDTHRDIYYFVKRQAMWLGVGAILCVVAAAVDYHIWQKGVWLFLGLATFFLVLCFLPPFGLRINGSARWLNLGIGTFQPSEFAKIAVIGFLAWWFSRHEKRAAEFLHGLAYPGLVAAVPLALILLEVDIGSTLLITATMAAIMFVAGTSLRFLLPLGGVAAAVGVAAVYLIPERLGRVLAFRDLEAYEQGAGLQQMQALIAFGSGGVEGLGLGNGRQKMLYLPYAHTDFIFPMIGEELGLPFTLLIVFVYLLIFVCGTCIAVNSKDRFGMLLGFGLTMIIGLQAAINIGVTTALLPNKGLPLPFISYGGSNLMLCLAAVGILINIHRQGQSSKPGFTARLLQARTIPRM